MITHDLHSCAWLLREPGQEVSIPATVPGCVHTDLLKAGRIPDPFWSTNELALQWIEEKDWEYETSFEVPEALSACQHLDLVCEGLDTLATLWLNGEELGKSDNMFVAHRWSLEGRLRAGSNQLRIRFANTKDFLATQRTDLENGELNDPKGRAPAIRKQQCQFGWDWGPRLVTAGIWKAIRLEAWNTNRLLGVRLSQSHQADGTVLLAIEPELAKRLGRARVEASLSFDGHQAGDFVDGKLQVSQPRLWWPNDLGAQPLYQVDVRLLDSEGQILDTWTRRIGLRTIRLDRHADAAGETFQFLVNGLPIFAKGANWIPAHSFVSKLERSDYARDLLSAKQAHMNMIRVWGGGIYESDDFYDLCDELGLLVWQDFMFACALYPGDKDFLASVSLEAEQQIRRLRHHASLALWCGNNEAEQLNVARLKKAKNKKAYRDVFERLLPRLVAGIDGHTDYWPSSQHRPDGDNRHEAGERHGDTHYWDVWHARHPVKDYERWRFRFCSEFGMQSYSSPETNRTFCPPDDSNILGPSMENHQKNRGGNQVILDYVTRRYRYPKSQDDLIYLSQLNQAYCMQTGVEHFRRLMPHCMGALYWQLNDCWPVASWSSIEHTGRWRALHHLARRFFAPLLVSAHLPAEEANSTGNYRVPQAGKVDLYTVCDLQGVSEGLLRWELRGLEGATLRSGSETVTLRYGESRKQCSLDLASELEQHGRDRCYLRIRLEQGGSCVSEETVFLSAPRFLDLPKAEVDISWEQVDDRTVKASLRSPVFQHRACLELDGFPHFAEANYVELYPNEARSLLLHFPTPVSVDSLRGIARVRTLSSTY